VAWLERAYSLFNDRQVDDLLAMMSDDVEWPDVANGAVLRGKEAVRSYWVGQFAVANPQVTPTDFIEVGNDVVVVIDQIVLDLSGAPLVPSFTVFHRYRFDDSLVDRMEVFTDRDQAVVRT